MSKLSDKVYEFLKNGPYESNVYYQTDDILILSGVSGVNTNGFTIEIIGKDTDKKIISYLLVLAHFPIRIPVPKRMEIQYLFNELNRDQWFTNLSIDMKTGDVMCTASNISNNNDAWNESFIEPILFLPLNRLDGLTHSIMELLYSEKTVHEILEKINPQK
jgi:hypothetical protein